MLLCRVVNVVRGICLKANHGAGAVHFTATMGLRRGDAEHAVQQLVVDSWSVLWV